MRPQTFDVVKRHLPLDHTGKVRHTFRLPQGDVQLVSATDNVSAFDFVLPIQIPEKGEILTAMNVFWRGKITGHQHDLAGMGSDIDRWLPSSLHNNPEIQKVSTVVWRLNMVPVECIARKRLTGSGWKDYKAGNPVSGHVLPPGLYDGAELPQTIFTPSTKAEVGHDEPIPFESVVEEYGRDLERKTIDIFDQGARYAESCGIVLADTKFEFGWLHDELLLADEVLTPDSSRFWPVEDIEAARIQGRTPFSYDKQYVRDECKKLGLPDLKPENPDHKAIVAGFTFDQSVIDETRERYNVIFTKLTGMTLRQFQRDVMKIKV